MRGLKGRRKAHRCALIPPTKRADACFVPDEITSFRNSSRTVLSSGRFHTHNPGTHFLHPLHRHNFARIDGYLRDIQFVNVQHGACRPRCELGHLVQAYSNAARAALSLVRLRPGPKQTSRDGTCISPYAMKSENVRPAYRGPGLTPFVKPPHECERLSRPMIGRSMKVHGAEQGAHEKPSHAAQPPAPLADERHTIFHYPT